MFKNISIIGVGNLTQALLTCIKNSQSKFNIKLYDTDKKKKLHVDQDNWKFYAKVNESIKDSDLIIIAVKPNKYHSVCDTINKYNNKRLVIVSLMAGISIKDLKNRLSDNYSLARVMTNINAKYGNAISSICLGQNFSKEKISSLRKFFSLFGSIKISKSEIEMDKITALIGSGPAYFIYFAESMIKTFQKFGFSKDESSRLVSELFYGTAITCKQDKRDFDEIKKSVVSKGGTTEAALKNFDKLQTKKIIMESIKKAYFKARNIGKCK